MILSLSRAGGKSMRVFEIGPKRDDGDRVCCEVFAIVACFGMYLISNEEKKVNKFERGLNSCIRIMMSYFDIQDFSQLVDRALIYEESLKENAVEYMD
jgi:hypothetical protein